MVPLGLALAEAVCEGALDGTAALEAAPAARVGCGPLADATASLGMARTALAVTIPGSRGYAYQVARAIPTTARTVPEVMPTMRRETAGFGLAIREDGRAEDPGAMDPRTGGRRDG
ncbi:MAG: hypothetical protein JW751_20175 [Polyangiaceae bacterium]|nr:hypothetical protein [Polyangiaceae bacterium]